MLRHLSRLLAASTMVLLSGASLGLTLPSQPTAKPNPPMTKMFDRPKVVKTTIKAKAHAKPINTKVTMTAGTQAKPSKTKATITAGTHAKPSKTKATIMAGTHAKPSVASEAVKAESPVDATTTATTVGVPNVSASAPTKPSAPRLPNLAAKKGFVLMGLVVQESTLNDLASIFDAFQVQLKGDDQDVLAVSACYRAKDGTYLEFDADDGDEAGRISQMTLSKDSMFAAMADCDTTNRFTAAAGFKNGVHLGMDKNDVLEKMGDPEDIGNHKFIYSFEDDDMDIEFEFDKNNKVETISLFKVGTVS